MGHLAHRITYVNINLLAFNMLLLPLQGSQQQHIKSSAAFY